MADFRNFEKLTIIFKRWSRLRYHTLIDVYGKGKRVSSVMELCDELVDNRDSSSKPTINTLKIFIKSRYVINHDVKKLKY